ncbi:MAG: hypothetical protein ACOC4M_16525, partial [Promethearchaeia archaeon]
MKNTNKVFLLTFFLCFGIILSIQSTLYTNLQETRNVNTNENEEDSPSLKPIQSQSQSTTNESLSPSPVQISNLTGEGDSREAKVATDSSKNVHIVWADNTFGKYDIYYRNFTYTTQEWGEILNISSSSSENRSRNPDIAIDSSDNIHITWTENEKNINYRFIKSPDFDISEIIVIASDEEDDFDGSSIATNGTNTVTISWYKDIYGGIYMGYYDFVEEKLLYEQEISSDGQTPQIIYSDENLLHVVFRDGTNIKYLNRSDTGWSLVYNLTEGLDPSLVRLPDIAYDEKHNNIYVCWAMESESGADREIIIKSKPVDGAFPIDPSDQISEENRNHYTPRIDIDKNGMVYVIYKYESNKIYFRRINDGKELKISETDDLPSLEPDLSVDVNGSVHFVFEDDDEIKYRIWDTFLPQLNVTHPLNNSYLSGEEMITATVEPDTSRIEFHYNDSGEWIYIGETNKTENWEFEWETNKTGNELNFHNIVLNTTAYNKNGLDETVLIGDLVVDNIPPQKCKIVEIYDTSEYYTRNSSKDTRNFNGTVHIKYEVYDNNSGIDYVSLYNGSDFITNNDTVNEFVIETDEYPGYDGNYTDLKIIAYDRAGNLNTSASYPGEGEYIIIDNVPPDVSFPDLTNGTQVTGEIDLKIETDLDVVNVTFWNFTDDIAQKTQLTTPITNDSQGRWETTFDSGDFDGNMSFVAIATDGNNHSSFELLELIIDNTHPEIDIINLEDGQDIGIADTKIIIEVELDTEMVNMSYKYGVEPYELIGSNSTFYNDSESSDRKRTELWFTEASEIDVDEDEGFYLEFWAIDDVGLEHTVEFHLYLDFETPVALESENLLYETDKYNIT